ncbi:MAG: glycosyltransferase [Archaeoglobus sp.]|nr:glycosyltransferase [Archaeoglobus sp.]
MRSRVVNVLVFLSPFFVSAILTWFFSVPGILAVLSYLVFLGMMIGAFTFIVFLKQYVSAMRYLPPLFSRYAEYRIAAVIPTYNEDPEIVRGTAISVMLALKGRGDVFILDDSTSDYSRSGIQKLEKLGVKIFRRKDRRGYKAGAINDFLKARGKEYTLLAIFDSDQRPLNSFFDEILHHFADERVAFVQVPQAYTELETGVGMAAYWQQQPFLRFIMRGRKSSAFSLGSGTVFRIKALEEVGGLDEENITEDVATSVKLHGRGYKSIYIDKPLVWYGEPPKDLKAYLSQQARWALGGFQLLGSLLKERLTLSAFVDYIASWMYWFKEGPITVVEIIAPIVFLLFDVHFLKIDAFVYLATYMPFFISTLVVFIVAARKLYGFRGFVYHQTIELLAFPSITASFFAWLLRRQRPFAVTRKKAEKIPLKLIVPYVVILLFLLASVVKGIFILTNPVIRSAALVNIFWAAYFIPFIAFGIHTVLKYYKKEEEVKIFVRV